MDIKELKFSHNDEGVTIIDYTGIEEVLEIPKNIDGKSVTILGQSCFQGNYNVKEIVFANSVKIIEKYAFKNLVITKITFNEGVEFIGEEAFLQCDRITEIVLPKSLLTIDSSAFLKCRGLKKVTVLNEKTTIAKNAFKDCTGIEEIDFCVWRYLSVQQLMKIVTKKFDCWNTLSIEEQKQILAFIKKKTTLKKSLFLSGDASIVSILFNANISLDLDTVNEYLEHSIAKKQVEITAIFLEYKSKNFSSDEVAENSENKELVEIGLELPTLKQFKAKWKCSSVAGGLRVSGYKGTNTVEVIPESLACGTKIIGLNYSPSGNFNPIKKLTIESPITDIPKKVFSFSSTLEEVILPDTITSIGKQVFQKCLNLKTFKIPPKVTVIEAETFGNCGNLESVEFHDNLTQINELAFLKCAKLSNVSIPKSVTKILSHAFANCLSLLDKDGFIIFNDILCSYEGKDSIVTIPNNVKVITRYAFYYAFFEEVIIPDSVELIQHQGFSYCSNLTKVTISPNTTVEKNAFYSCSYKHK